MADERNLKKASRKEFIKAMQTCFKTTENLNLKS